LTPLRVVAGDSLIQRPYKSYFSWPRKLALICLLAMEIKMVIMKLEPLVTHVNYACKSWEHIIVLIPEALNLLRFDWIKNFTQKKIEKHLKKL